MTLQDRGAVARVDRPAEGRGEGEQLADDRRTGREARRRGAAGGGRGGATGEGRGGGRTPRPTAPPPPGSDPGPRGGWGGGAPPARGPTATNAVITGVAATRNAEVPAGIERRAVP